MKFLHVLPFFSALATAAPVTARAEDVAIQREGITFEASEVQAAAIFRNELINGNSGSCPQAIFIFARGSMELDNMVITFHRHDSHRRKRSSKLTWACY